MFNNDELKTIKNALVIAKMGIEKIIRDDIYSMINSDERDHAIYKAQIGDAKQKVNEIADIIAKL